MVKKKRRTEDERGKREKNRCKRGLRAGRVERGKKSVREGSRKYLHYYYFFSRFVGQTLTASIMKTKVISSTSETLARGNRTLGTVMPEPKTRRLKAEATDTSAGGDRPGTGKSRIHALFCALNICAGLLFATSCGQKGPEGLISVDFNKTQEVPAMNISELAGEPEFIALESSPEAFATGGQYNISQNYICIGASSRGSAKLYDRHTGKFLCDVGTVGRGPGEYLNTYSGQIDEADGTVWLIPWNATSILGYDIHTGKYKKEIPLKYDAPKGVFSIDNKNGSVTVAALPFQGIVPAIAWQQDMEGNVLWEIPAGHFAMTLDFSNEIASSDNVKGTFDLSMTTWDGKKDSLYVVEQGKIMPVYTVDFGNTDGKFEDRPIHSYTLTGKYLICDYAFPVRNEYGYTTSRPEYIVTDRKSEETVRTSFFNDFLGEELDYLYTTDGYLCAVFDPETFIELSKNALENGKLNEKNRQKIADIAKSLTPESNNVIMLASLKK